MKKILILILHLINKNKIDNIDMSLKCNQRYYVRQLFKHKLAQDKNKVLEKVQKILGKRDIIKFTDYDINCEKINI